MCDPVTIGVTTAAISAASSIAGFMGQAQARKANNQAAAINYAGNHNAYAQQAAQEDAQQSENTVDALIARLTAQGSISASASSLGADSSTTTAKSNQAAFQVGRDLSIKNLNTDNARAQTARDQEGAILQKRSQVNAVAKANPVSLVLGIAKSGLEGANTYASVGGKF